MNNTPPKSLVRQFSLSFLSGAFAVALALLLVLVLRSIAVQISPPPKYLDQPYPDVSTKTLCEEAGGRWVLTPVKNSGGAPAPIVDQQPYCQGPLAFERSQTTQSERSQQTSLFVFAIGGAIAAALSLLMKALKPIAPGLMIGAIVSFFITATEIWMMSPGIGRLITIVAIFIILAGIGVYTFGEKKQSPA